MSSYPRTHATIRELQDAGFAEVQAEAVVAGIIRSGSELVTKADIKERDAGVRVAVAQEFYCSGSAKGGSSERSAEKSEP